mgnify:CR=1 FL=1
MNKKIFVLVKNRNIQNNFIDESKETPYEIHFISFNSNEDFKEFMNDKKRLEFIHLKKKHDWQNSYLNHSDWKFLRMRPPNFPTVRIAQFAELIRSNCSLISLLLEMQDLKTIKTLFETPLNDYWQKHYHFGKKGNGNHSVIGRSAFESICINTMIPMLICYSAYKNDSKYEEKALRWMRETKEHG